jgi:hypothetical protein
VKTSWSPERCVVWFLAIPSGWAAWTCRGAVSSVGVAGVRVDSEHAHVTAAVSAVITTLRIRLSSPCFFPLRNQLRNPSHVLPLRHGLADVAAPPISRADGALRRHSSVRRPRYRRQAPLPPAKDVPPGSTECAPTSRFEGIGAFG